MPANAKPKWTLWAIGNAIAVFPIVLLFNYLGKPASGFPAALFCVNAWDGSQSSMGVEPPCMVLDNGCCDHRHPCAPDLVGSVDQ